MNLLRAASVVSLLTLASRITGLVREQLIAASFGATAMSDAYQVAFRIPNLLRRLFAEGAFSQAFVPILAATRAKEGDEATHALIDAVTTVLLWALLVTCAAGVVGAPVLVWLMAAGFGPEAHDAAVVMTRWMFPYIGCMSLVALAAGILNTWKRFAVPAATPVLLNLSVIAAAWLLAPHMAGFGYAPIHALAVGVMAGGVIQLAVQVPALRRAGVMPKLSVGLTALHRAWAHPGVHRILRQMAPALLGVSVAQLSLLVNTQIASHLPPGSVSWLTYADRLMEFPTALLGVALGVVLTPQLSAAQASGETQAYSDLLDWGLRLVLLLAAPCSVALLVFPEPLTAVLYHYGRINGHDVAQTVLALRGYGAGLLGLVAVKVLAPGFYARQDIRTPVKISIVVLALTQLMNVVFVPVLGHAGLALSIGLAACVNALWLLVGLRRRGSYQPSAGWMGFLLRVGLACGVMGAGLAWAAQAIDWIALRDAPLLRVTWLAGALLAAALLYFGALRASGLPLRQFLRKG
ncbi:MAG TPA: murein biosynthesis integral membrane protein MurJ [Burkholderiaceae bacterium]|nr:murein biosynthesis integral membrane protein MurJ [Burkholderiaceae bacterium]HMX09754.1 murein biosynthesis integral membrane protein MurJ [Burkholderiaceae bacterium]HMY99254.1 murein biosynthesis integral membrane protein MurJ [Burkholderiaceae bacterium]HNB44495.1 murein biosynthesis integral membrane protein MurJ [Burkholderiaceae bacterium]HNG79535.1 murein biosynthesis integral membrane protein MurJ [Burkholderiaceae bacterium]